MSRAQRMGAGARPQRGKIGSDHVEKGAVMLLSIGTIRKAMAG